MAVIRRIKKEMGVSRQRVAISSLQIHHAYTTLLQLILQIAIDCIGSIHQDRITAEEIHVEYGPVTQLPMRAYLRGYRQYH
ncbi:hypothetical protein RHOFW104T7_08405 [Rhodanobacter thiooxydans]|uniref:Uncharacterized protein n=1 Tax=Rhodanobacter thiooxydans TaxID=416169 RepID=A0A154QKG7_9GAMM|nr:hypothetical protein RHOFW104T7_08405 [Rhodanobacter thiooxydans]